jgi:ketosteroid isomerase-like protein
MSQGADPMTITREVFFAANSEEHLERVLAHFAPDAVWENTPEGPFLGARGRAEIAALLADWWSIWDEHEHYIEEMVDLGGGVIYAVVREDGRISGSEARVEQTNGFVLEWADGLVTRVTVHANTDAGRIAAERLSRERR